MARLKEPLPWICVYFFHATIKCAWKDLVYSGACDLEELVDVPWNGGVKLPAGKLVLSPTRTYAPVVPQGPK
eukprot:6318389-Amphidinium_carterae.2